MTSKHSTKQLKFHSSNSIDVKANYTVINVDIY